MLFLRGAFETMKSTATDWFLPGTKFCVKNVTKSIDLLTEKFQWKPTN